MLKYQNRNNLWIIEKKGSEWRKKIGQTQRMQKATGTNTAKGYFFGAGMESIFTVRVPNL